MSELKDKIQHDLSGMQLANLATLTEEGLPWTRYVMIQADRTLTIRCATHLNARKVAHIQNNPEIHVTCGVLDPAHMKPYYQIQGRAEVSTDDAERHGFWNPSLESIFSGKDDPAYAVIVIKPYRIECYTPPEMSPEVLELI